MNDLLLIGINFNVYCGPTIWPNNDQGLEDLARYIIRACFLR